MRKASTRTEISGSGDDFEAVLAIVKKISDRVSRMGEIWVITLNRSEQNRLRIAIDSFERARRSSAAAPAQAQAEERVRVLHHAHSPARPVEMIDGRRFTGFGREFIWRDRGDQYRGGEWDGALVRYAYYE